MRTVCTILLLVMCNSTPAQLQNVEPDETEEQHLEDLSESTEAESEDEYYVQQLASYKDHPLNINGSAEDLNDFPLLEPLQTGNLIKYRQLLGDFISVYELQSVPGFSISLIKRILPYITIAGNDANAEIRERFTNGDRTLVFRPTVVPEQPKGFSSNTPPEQKYQGGKDKMMVRYKYQYRNLLQYGIVADQDAGEKFTFKGARRGFDFYSIYLFTRKLGVIKSLALGDYTVNLGQGLIQWQSQAYNKSSGVINIKRQSEILRPYHSAGEFNFMRGLGMTLKKWNVESTLFASFVRLSANIDDDGLYGKIMTSIQTSGLHRTLSEIENRNVAALATAGGNLRWQKEAGQLGINAVRYHYSIPLLKNGQPYNLYAVKGRDWANYSVDYSFTFRNYHVFGELATDKEQHRAAVGGLMASLNPTVDIAVLLRSISPAYQSIYGNAFTENTMPSNENGVYTGVSIKPAPQWKIDMYADLFRFPWLRYRADAPGFGCQYLVQLNWQPNKKVEVYSRFRFRLKPINESFSQAATGYPQDKLLRNWRTNVSFHLNHNLLLRNRIEFCWYGMPGEPDPQAGFLLYTDILYKPFGKSWSVSGRFQVFETDGYDTRLYAYENDVLFSNSTPAFFDKGSRIFLNLKARLRVRVIPGYQAYLGLKSSATLYSGKTSIGSGLDEISGSQKSEIKIQVVVAAG